jgi:hypothetical protein
MGPLKRSVGIIFRAIWVWIFVACVMGVTAMVDRDNQLYDDEK